MDISLRSERSGRVVRVTVDGSARGNSFTTPTLRALVETVQEAAVMPACSLVRLDMRGTHFCSGWDTGSFTELASTPVDDIAAQLRESDELVNQLRSLRVPIVSGARGRIIGFGVGLLAAVHLPIIAAEASISLPEVRFGFAPGGVGHMLAQALPRAHVYALLTGTSTLSGISAHSAGLASHVVPDAELDVAVDELVASLAELEPSALRAVAEVIESSRLSGRPDGAYLASARTIVGAEAGKTTKGTR